MSENKNNRFTAKQIEKLKKDFVPKQLVIKKVKEGKTLQRKLPMKFSPASWKQDQFRKCTSDIVIYGGSLGGGKTHNGLTKLLMGVSDPNFRAMIIRKQMNIMTRSGGIVDESKKLYKEYNSKVRFNNTKNFFRWPSGAEIAFTQVSTDEDAEGLRGAQWSMVLCDEATELDEAHVFQIQSRIRSDAVQTKAPRQLILTCNPNPDSYLRQWVDWWLIPEGKENAGRPDPAKECATRYFVRVDGLMHWADTPEELIERFPSEDEENPTRPVSVTFVAATIFDNPPLLKNNPNYLSNLRSLPKVKQERDLYGNWNIREEGTSFWKREWCPELNTPPSWMEFQEIVRAYDFAGTLPNAQNRDPDWFACVKIGKLKGKMGGYVLLDAFRTRIQVGEWSKTILDIAEKDGGNVTVLIPEDPNPQAKANSMQMAHELIQNGLKVKRMRTNQKKIERFATFATFSQNGFVSIVKGIGNEVDHVNGAKKQTVINDNTFLYNELENFDGGRKGHDDLVDCCSDAIIHLGLRRRFDGDILAGLTGMNLSNQSKLANL